MSFPPFFLLFRSNSHHLCLSFFSGACSAIMKVTIPVFDDQLATSWKKYENLLLYWVIKAIGDLAANNPNNQTKFGREGACELLVAVLDHEPVSSKSPAYISFSLLYLFVFFRSKVCRSKNVCECNVGNW
jgi:hypothetical protein